jgi:hypothetical protein
MPGRGKGVAAAATILGRGVGMRPMRVVALAEAAQLLDIGLIGVTSGRVVYRPAQLMGVA